MSWDIFGNYLKPGYCEVHPDVAEPYPCYYCYQERDEEEQAQQQQREDYEKEMYEQYLKDQEKEPQND